MSRLELVLLSATIAFLADLASAIGWGAAIAAKLEPALPKSWTVVAQKSGVLPEGHYWGQEYSGARGEEVLLQGGADVHVAWLDVHGEWRSEVVGKEALKLYVMPPNYSESWRRFLVPKRPATARLLVETDTFKVYAQPSFRVIEYERLGRIVRESQAIRWPDSPESTGTLSWETWSADISRLLRGA